MKKDVDQIRKQNMKIYSIYRMISADHIFYYAIEFIFLLQVKGISAADMVLAAAAYSLFRTLLQIPIVIIVDKLGKKKSVVIANLFISGFIVIIMNCKNLGMLILAQFIDSIGFSLKEASDTSLLNSSIPDSTKKGEIFSKIEGKGIKNYYFFTAITSVIAGIIYEINPYIPLIISLIISVLSAIISLGFEDVIDEKENNSKYKTDFKLYIKDLNKAFKFIVKSSRLKALLLYSGIMWGFINLTATYITSLLEELGAIAVVIAIISSAKEIASGIGAKKQFSFNKRFKNKSLEVILLIDFICILSIGIIGILKLNIAVSIATIAILAICMNYIRGIHEVSTTTYLQNFTTPKILPKIYAMNSISRNLFRIIISLFGSFLLRQTNTANSTIIFSIVFLFLAVEIVIFMKSRLGLKPEDYKIEDIHYK